MRFTKQVLSKTSSVDRHTIFEYKHTSCSNTRKMITPHQVLILCNKGTEKHEFFSLLQRDNSPWDVDVIPLIFRVN